MESPQVLGAGGWNANLYDARHAFVWKSAGGILEWLAAEPNETILDVGCGTGHVTAQIAQLGAQVVGLDASSEMLETARREYPHLRWIEGDARDFSVKSLGLREPVDAIFSNATLHWVRPPQAFLKCTLEVLKPGGRLVGEFGGQSNVERVLQSIEAGLREVQVDCDVRVNYFPSVAEYASLCEESGLQVLRAELFERSTPLEGEAGLRDWAQMLRTQAIEAVPEARRERFFQAMEEAARPHLRNEQGWFADYRRLRIFAVKD